MGLGSMLGDMLGNTEKAILCIQRIEQPTGFSVGDMLRATNKALTTISISIGKKDWTKDNELLKKALGDGFHIMKVQYNPNSLSFNSQAGNFQTSQGAGAAGLNEIQQVVIPAQVGLTVELVFDAMNLTDSFSLSSQTLSVNTAISGIKSLFNDYTVQTQVDGLLALTTQRVTRRVVFHWADMTFVGEIETINAKYTMFSRSGRPVRAVVTLSIRNRMADDDRERDLDTEAYWANAFDKLFGPPEENRIIKSSNQDNNTINALTELF